MAVAFLLVVGSTACGNGTDSTLKWGDTAVFDEISVTVSAPKLGAFDASATDEHGAWPPTDPGDRLVEVLVEMVNHSRQTFTQAPEYSFSFSAYDSAGSAYSGTPYGYLRKTVDPPFPQEIIAPGKTVAGYYSWMVPKDAKIVQVMFTMTSGSGEHIKKVWGD
jgi:Domain of unknown function (DUF4352)